jgi:hypothetical protein
MKASFKDLICEDAMNGDLRMKRTIFWGYSIFFLFIISCTKNVNESDENGGYSYFTINGYVYYNGLPLNEARISLSDLTNYYTYSDTTGCFELNELPKGTHDLLIYKTMANNKYIEKSMTTQLNDDLFLDIIQLPRIVDFHSTGLITDRRIELSWIPTTASHFIEYRIMRHLTVSQIELQGILVYSSSNCNDTSFADILLQPAKNYFYQMFTYFDDNCKSGSSIILVTTEESNFIWNGDFEESESLSNWWYAPESGTASYCDSIKMSGSRSLMLTSEIGENSGIYTTISHSPFDGFIPDNSYKLSGWIKTSGEVGNDFPEFWADTSYKAIIYFENSDIQIGIGGNTDWQYIEQIIEYKEIPENPKRISLHSVSEYVWFDELRMIKYD